MEWQVRARRFNVSMAIPSIGFYGRPISPEVTRGLRVIGRWVRTARWQRGLTQRQAAALSGLHQSTISRLENGKLDGLRLSRFAVLMDVLAQPR
jgi:hypothetical protein